MASSAHETSAGIRVDRFGVAVAGGTLAVFRFAGSADPQPAVLAAHGITASSHGWFALARALEGRVAIFAPDLRGRGESNQLPGPYGGASHVADLLACLDQLPLERPAVVVGHSLGAYLMAALAAEYPERVRHAVLVDGGLRIPGSERIDPQVFLDAFLGPALARLKLTFESKDAYRDWWRAHPALSGSDVAEGDIVAYADHDLVGEPPQLHSSVAEAAVRGDAAEAARPQAPAAERLTIPVTLLCAPRGMVNDDNPVQPLELVRAWAAQAPGQRRAVQVPDCNHYTIAMGRAGATALAGEVLAALAR